MMPLSGQKVYLLIFVTGNNLQPTKQRQMAKNPNEIGVVILEDDKITIQEASYIEHGWYIEIIHDEITLYEIPYGGGEPIKISSHSTLNGALEAKDNLF